MGIIRALSKVPVLMMCYVCDPKLEIGSNRSPKCQGHCRHHSVLALLTPQAADDTNCHITETVYDGVVSFAKELLFLPMPICCRLVGL